MESYCAPIFGINTVDLLNVTVEFEIKSYQ